MGPWQIAGPPGAALISILAQSVGVHCPRHLSAAPVPEVAAYASDHTLIVSALRQEMLFADASVREVIEKRGSELWKAIDGYPSEQLLNTSPEDLVSFMEEQFWLHSPSIEDDRIRVEQLETKIDVSKDRMRFPSGRSTPFHIPGVQVVYHVPFTGDGKFFGITPTSYAQNRPTGAVAGSELQLHNAWIHDQVNADAVKRHFEGELSRIRQHLATLRRDTDAFNSCIGTNARTAIMDRRSRLLANAGLAESLGYPLVRRGADVTTYSAPEVRRTLPLDRPSSPAGPYSPQPTLDPKEYEHILKIIDNAMETLERMPKAAAAMDEEDLRTLILVMLNSHYEGQATGETFNYAGKTDIFVRSETGNVFVAECKFWTGPSGLAKTVDQILRYVTWRETKAAIIVFNRNRGFSEMKASAGEAIRLHPQYKRSLSVGNDGRPIRVVLGHPEDTNREVTLSVLVFDVPHIAE